MDKDNQARSDRPTTAPLVRVRLDAEVERLKQEPEWRSGTRNAITITKEPSLRLVLTVLRKGVQLDPHRAPGPLTLQVISGRLRLKAPGQTVELGSGELAVLEAAVEHEVGAMEESVFLLTLVQPPSRA